MLKISRMSLEWSDTQHGHVHTRPEHPNTPGTQSLRQQKPPDTEQPSSEQPSNWVLKNRERWWNQTLGQGNCPVVARATDTAGLRCPPDTPPLTITPSNTPTPHLNKGSRYLCLLLVTNSPPVNGEEVSLAGERQDWLSNGCRAKHHQDKCSWCNGLLSEVRYPTSFNSPRNSAKNSRIKIFWILQPRPTCCFFPIV